jgi:hypothetical protein
MMEVKILSTLLDILDSSLIPCDLYICIFCVAKSMNMVLNSYKNFGYSSSPRH